MSAADLADDGKRSAKKPTRVFVSYAHESEAHKAQVGTLAGLLRSQGIDVDLDQAHYERQDWSAWVAEEIKTSDFVLVVASSGYLRVGDGTALRDDHRGVQTEAGILRDRLYFDRPTWTRKILPVVLPGGSVDEIPLFLQPRVADHYLVTSFTEEGMLDLLEVLSGRTTRREQPLGTPTFRSRGDTERILSGAMDDAARSLAQKALQQWQLDEERRGVTNSFLPIRWSVTAAAEATMPGVSWSSLDVADAAHLASRFGDIEEMFLKRLPHHRLVILGEPGAGKSTLAGRLARDLATNWQPGKRVPIVLDMSRWNPAKDRLPDWMARELAGSFRELGRSAPGNRDDKPTMAQVLVDSSRILPIIEGLDSMSKERREAAISAIDTLCADFHLVLTSDAAAYGESIEAHGRGLSRTAVVELLPLTAQEVHAYLEPAGNSGWHRMLEVLRDEPGGVLAQALRTPLMISLVRAVYRRTSADAGELLDQERFPDRASIEDHLLDSLVATAYEEHPTPAARRPTDDAWLADDAKRWLSFLAWHISREESSELLWWRLHRSLRFVEPMYLIAGGFGFGFFFGYAFEGTAFGLGFGLLLSAISATPQGRKIFGLSLTDTPRRFVASARRTRHTLWSGFARALRPLIPLTAGYTLLTLADESLWPAVVGGLLIAVSLGMLVFEIFRKSPPLDHRREQVIPAGLPRAESPESTLREDRVATLLPAALVVVVVAPLSFVMSDWRLLILGFSIAGAWAVIGAAYTKYSLTRLILAIRGWLPLRTMRFLRDAVDRGVLRQVGAAYQFRYPRLQERLAAGHGPGGQVRSQ